MDGSAPADARQRTLGFWAAGTAVLAGWLLSIPPSDALESDDLALGLLRFSFLVGGSLATLGYVLRRAPLVWGGSALVAATLDLQARGAWFAIPLGILVLVVAGLWQAAQPPRPAPVLQAGAPWWTWSAPAPAAGAQAPPAMYAQPAWVYVPWGGAGSPPGAPATAPPRPAPASPASGAQADGPAAPARSPPRAP